MAVLLLDLRGMWGHDVTQVSGNATQASVTWRGADREHTHAFNGLVMCIVATLAKRSRP